ncbi:hypothetical protein AGRA3207_003715 [Actinomadura graeca]|uniref:Uncharacterized protein n=1 Tax=Actinomadura graeca TaxID=2750812 RepID=A0ABX8QY95_9ACTN|nr:hypothetical protein [Actinomadura graeca]QXJ22672.1 hypothetical protein AGRA3207_003715 [Actinomadura graeca]
MPVPPSALARLRPARRRPVPVRVARRFVTRPTCDLLGEPADLGVPEGPDGPGESAGPAWAGRRRRSSWAWTLYSRWEWVTATARAERVLRRSRPPWR